MLKLIKELFITVSPLGLVFYLIDLRIFASRFNLVMGSLVGGPYSPSLGFILIVLPRALVSRIIARSYFS